MLLTENDYHAGEWCGVLSVSKFQPATYEADFHIGFLIDVIVKVGCVCTGRDKQYHGGVRLLGLFGAFLHPVFDMTAKLMQYLRLLDEKKNAEVYSKEIDKDIQRLKALLIAEMGTSCTAVCEQEGVNYTVTYTPVRKSVIDKDNLLRLKLEHPDIYEQFVTVSESRRFSVRASIMEAA